MFKIIVREGKIQTYDLRPGFDHTEECKRP